MADYSITGDTRLDTSGFTKGISSMTVAAGNLISDLTKTAATKLAGLAKSLVSVGMNFDASMSQVAATMGKSVDEIDNLTKVAKEMGSTTKFTATQAADALNYLALAGYDADKAAEVLPSVLNLAAAGGMDLAYASDLVTDAMASLNIEANKQNVDEFGNKLAMAASKANANVAQLGEAILTVGGTAANLKGGTTELTTALGLLANVGIKSAEGGTHLRNIILSLQSPTDEATKLMQKLGLSVYDSQGKMRGLNDILGDLNSAMNGMTQGQKDSIINRLFNKTDLAAVNGLLAAQGEQWGTLAAQIDNADGAMGQMAETQQDNLQGVMTSLGSAFEGLQLAVYNELEPSLTDLGNYGIECIRTLTTALSDGGPEAMLQAAGQIISDLAGSIVEQLPSLMQSGVEIITQLAENIVAATPAMLDTAAEVLGALAQGLVDNIPDLIASAAEVIAGFIGYLGDHADEMMTAGLQIIESLIIGITDNLPGLIEAAGATIAKFAAALISNLPKILECAATIMTTLVDGILYSIENLAEAALACIAKLVGVWDGNMDEFGHIGENIVQGIINGIAGMWGKLTSWVSGLIANLVGTASNAATTGVASGAASAVASAYNGKGMNRDQRHQDALAGKGISNKSWTERQSEAKAAAAESQKAASTISQSAGKAASAVSTSGKKASTSAKTAAAEVVKSISDTTTTVKDGVTRTVETVNETLSNGKKQQKQTITETSRQMVDGVLKDVKTITEVAADGTKTVKQTMEDVKASVQTTVKDTQTSIVDGAQVTVEKTTETLTDGSERVSTVTTRTGTEVIEGVERTVKTVTTKTADGVETTVKTIEDAGPQYASAGELLTTQLRTKLEDGWKDIKKDIQTDAVGAIKTLANALKNGDLEQLGFWAASYFWQACTDKQREQITAIAQGALDQLGNALSGVGNKLAALASSLVAKFVPAATTATGAQEGLNVAMEANPILLVISLIGMLVGALLNFASTNKNVANGMNDVWSGVADFMSYIFEGLMYVLGLFVEQFVIEINTLIGAYNLVAQLWDGHIDYVSNPAWDYAKKIQKEREDRKNARLAKQEQAELDAEYARQSGDAEKKQLDAEYAKKAAELARAKLTEDDPGMLDAEKAVAAADYKKSVADLEKKLLDAEYKKQSAQIGKKTAADATALADLEKQLVEAENTLRMGDLERELLQLDYEKTLRDLEEKYKPSTPAEPEKPDASTDPGTPGTTPDKDNTDAIRDNTEALLAANSKLAEMVRQADSLVLSDNMAISRSVAASGTAKVAAAANQYHREGDTNITQNIYSKAQTAADLQREARWEADRAKAQKR